MTAEDILTNFLNKFSWDDPTEKTVIEEELAKRIPQRCDAIDDYERDYDGKEYVMTTFSCPTCKRKYHGYQPDYCSFCGQKIKKLFI